MGAERAAPRRRLRVEVVYALPREQALVALEVEEGTTARQAAQRSGLARRFPSAGIERAPLGIFGRRVAPDAPLRDGDRVEIYRALATDARSARRARARG